MKGPHEISIPIVAMVAGTRLALGIGIGLLLADRLNSDQRKSAGLALSAFGGLTTIPLVWEVFRAKKPLFRSHRRHEFSHN